MTGIDKRGLSLAYTPGVGAICMDIYHEPKLLDKYTFRGRSAAILTDGSLLKTTPKQFMPVMDWFVFQIKTYTGIDAYPFVVMKEANISEIVKNLANSYSIVIYLD
jgi:malate dehydrogenase (oxaloacetate-decarboxylating)